LRLTSFPIRDQSGAPVRIGLIVDDVTERKRVEDDLRQRELHFRMLADNIPQLAWIADQPGSMIWFNRGWFDFAGLTAEESVGSGWQRVLHPEHVARIEESMARGRAAGETWEDTYPMRGRDGEYRWFLSRATPIRDERGRVMHWFGTSTDVTEQRLLDDATAYLAESLEPSVTFPKISRLPIPTLADSCFVDVCENGTIRRVAWAHTDPEREAAWTPRVLGLSPSLTAASHPVVRAIMTGRVVVIPDQETGLEECFGIAAMSSAIIVPMMVGNRRVGALTFAFCSSRRRHHTVAQRRAAEELARRAAIAIDNVHHYEEARNAVRTRERVLAIVSHDLRDPLATIDLSLLRLQQQLGHPAVTRHLDVTRRATRRMETLIRDLLDMASIQVGKLALSLASVRYADIVDELVESHAPIAHEKGLVLEHESSLTDETSWCDRNRILQALGNLVGNAIKFCRPGDRICVHAAASATHVTIEISDTGPGIPVASLPRLFDAYWSGDGSAKPSTGLGLYIAKGIIDAHRGNIEVRSTVGQGTSFRIELPRASGEPVRQRSDRTSSS
jgi:PAS domain S-box-containing protein